MMRAPVRAGLFTCAVLLAAVLVGPPALPVAREAVGRTSGGRAQPVATVLAVLTRVPRPPSARELFPGPAEETPTAGAAATDPTEPEPGYAKGVITNSAGQPLAGADVTVAVYGTTMAGEDTSFETSVDAAGRYSLRVPDGLYRVEAWVTVPLAGGRHIAELHPVDGEQDAYQDAAEGVVEDFRWAISGRKPGTAGGDGT